VRRRPLGLIAGSAPLRGALLITLFPSCWGGVASYAAEGSEAFDPSVGDYADTSPAKLGRRMNERHGVARSRRVSVTIGEDYST